MTSLPERTAKKTLVASIVAPHGNGCKQASYSVHVTLVTAMFAEMLKNLQNCARRISESLNPTLNFSLENVRRDSKDWRP
jgi:hypothetical protein